MSFGRPIEMGGGWDLGQLLKTNYTHLVLNGIRKKFRYKKEMASCQQVIEAGGKYRRKQIIKFGKPVIFIFRPDDEAYNDKKFRRYLSESGAVFVEISKKLF